MSGKLAQRIAVVTGASKGIGRSISLALAHEGATVVLASRNASQLEQVAAGVRTQGGSASIVPTDVTDEEQVHALFEIVDAQFGRLDILVNNAGYGIFSAVEKTAVADFDGMWKVNLRGTFLCCKAAVPIMRRAKQGDIVNIASLAGKNSFVGGAAYSATKWGLIGFSRSLLLEVRDDHIRVITICPGSVNTEFSDHRHDADRIIQPEDVAETVLVTLMMPRRSNVSEIDIRPTVKPK